jgi:hypothetical protein
MARQKYIPKPFSVLEVEIERDYDDGTYLVVANVYFDTDEEAEEFAKKWRWEYLGSDEMGGWIDGTTIKYECACSWTRKTEKGAERLAERLNHNLRKLKDDADKDRPAVQAYRRRKAWERIEQTFRAPRPVKRARGSRLGL